MDWFETYLRWNAALPYTSALSHRGVHTQSWIRKYQKQLSTSWLALFWLLLQVTENRPQLFSVGQLVLVYLICQENECSQQQDNMFILWSHYLRSSYSLGNSGWNQWQCSFQGSLGLQPRNRYVDSITRHARGAVVVHWLLWFHKEFDLHSWRYVLHFPQSSRDLTY